MDQDRAKLMSLKPRSFAKYPALLQLGSTKASVAYCSELKDLLWDKLVEKFPDPTFNGVKIPGLPRGMTFRQKFAQRGVFPVEDYLPHIAIAFGKSWSFHENSARDFTLENLFAPGFGSDLTLKILDALKSAPSLSSSFTRFSSVSSYTSMPMDPVTDEIFIVENYLPEIQAVFDIVPSPEFAAPNFGLSDLKELVSPRVPSLRAFADTIKSKLVREIGKILNGVFQTAVNLPGFDSTQMGGNLSFPPNLSWPSDSTNVFTPTISLDTIQGCSFDLYVGQSESGSLSLDARITLGFTGVNPVQTLADIASGISSKLQSLSSDFEGLTNSLQSELGDVASLFADLSKSDKIKLLLNANIDLIVSLSLPSFDVSATLEVFDTSLSAAIGKCLLRQNEYIHPLSVTYSLNLTCTFSRINTSTNNWLTANKFSTQLGDKTLSFDPSIVLRLEAENTRTPIDLKENLSDITAFNFSGTFHAAVYIGVEDIPVGLYISASADDITTASSVDFEVAVDIDLLPLNATLTDLLMELGALAYPRFIQQSSSFLPRLDLSCLSKSGVAYLHGNSTNYPLSGFLKAMVDGCLATSNGLSLSGGYNSTSEEFGTYILSSCTLHLSLSTFLERGGCCCVVLKSSAPTYQQFCFYPFPAVNISIELFASRDVQAALNNLASLLGGSLFLDTSFYNNLLKNVELGGFILIDLTVGARISRSSISNGGGDYGSVDAYLRVNNFVATASLSASSLNLDFPLSLPAGGLSTVNALILELEDGFFRLDVSLNLTKPQNITDIFRGGEISNFEYGGSLDAAFPVKLSLDSLELGFTLMMNDDDIFKNPTPVVKYELNLCPIIETLKDAVTGLTDDLLDIISTEVRNIPIGSYIDFDRLTEPLMDYIDTTLSNFSETLIGELDGINCASGGRVLQESTSSFANVIDVAIGKVNDVLKSVGITINATVKPYFDSTEFAVGVETELSVDFELVRHFLILHECLLRIILMIIVHDIFATEGFRSN